MKILYVSTLSNTINAFMIPHIMLLFDQGHQVDIACNIDREIRNNLKERGCEVFNIEFQRTPLSKRNYHAYKKLKMLIKTGEYDLIHTHTPIASACVRLACKREKNTKVIYTAHGFHFHKGAPLKNWLIYYPIERYLSKYTDVLITINNEDYERAKRSFRAAKNSYIPGVGLDTKSFDNLKVDKLTKRKEIGVPEEAFLILSVGELNKNKNHETIIRAVAKLNNPNIHYVICGRGPLKSKLKELTRELGVDKQVTLLGFRKDVAHICQVADIFAFPSKREGLGMAALEAMASRLPIITSNVHGIVDYSIDGKTGFCNSPTDVDAFVTSIEKLFVDEDLRIRIGQYNKDYVNKFSLEIVTDKLASIYKNV